MSEVEQYNCVLYRIMWDGHGRFREKIKELLSAHDKKKKVIKKKTPILITENKDWWGNWGERDVIQI